MAIKIFIDQGHNPTGYHNTGARGNGLIEEDINFQVGIYLANLLENDPRFEVRLSRPTPTTVLGTTNASSLAEECRWLIPGLQIILSAYIAMQTQTRP